MAPIRPNQMCFSIIFIFFFSHSCLNRYTHLEAFPGSQTLPFQNIIYYVYTCEHSSFPLFSNLCLCLSLHPPRFSPPISGLQWDYEVKKTKVQARIATGHTHTHASWKLTFLSFHFLHPRRKLSPHGVTDRFKTNKVHQLRFTSSPKNASDLYRVSVVAIVVIVWM